MTIEEAIRSRHSVRQYQDRPIEEDKLRELTAIVGECNSRGGLHIQLVVGDPAAFDSRMAHYGHFSGVSNYFALIGPKGKDLDPKLGYWGEHLVLKAQMLGLNTCWVGLTYKKNPARLSIGAGERLRAVICVGYGANRGVAHKVKPFDKVAKALLPRGQEVPAWFRLGVEAALLAPTAMNQQKFRFTLLKSDNPVSEGASADAADVAPDKRYVVRAQSGIGFFSRMDLGIAQYHFELGAGAENFVWAK